MRRQRKELNIFSLSALDLFASALGAFILLAVIQFPYTKKNEDIVEAKRKTEQQLAQCTSKLDEATKRAKKEEADVEKCKQRLKNTFLAVILKWETKVQDVDLHVIDPDGNEFYYKRHNRNRNEFPSADAEISVDQIKGPGVEVWEYYQAKPGLYKIYANLYNRHGNPNNPVIKSMVYYRDGVKKLNNITLTSIGESRKKLIGTIEVNQMGEVVF